MNWVAVISSCIAWELLPYAVAPIRASRQRKKRLESGTAQRLAWRSLNEERSSDSSYSVDLHWGRTALPPRLPGPPSSGIRGHTLLRYEGPRKSRTGLSRHGARLGWMFPHLLIDFPQVNPRDSGDQRLQGDQKERGALCRESPRSDLLHTVVHSACSLSFVSFHIFRGGTVSVFNWLLTKLFSQTKTAARVRWGEKNTQ